MITALRQAINKKTLAFGKGLSETLIKTTYF
jgi:hypothetical protein